MKVILTAHGGKSGLPQGDFAAGLRWVALIVEKVAREEFGGHDRRRLPPFALSGSDFLPQTENFGRGGRGLAHS